VVTNDETRWNLLDGPVKAARASSAFRIMREHLVEPILIKGWAVARLYPSENHRHFSDLDLAVSPEQFELAEFVCNNDAARLPIDLHRGLRHFDSRPWAEIFNSCELIELNDTLIRIPSPEDHLRILCAHWLNDGGVDKERLWDIYYSVEKRPASFDWDKCLNGAGPARRSWVIYCIAITHEYLGLPIDDLPFRDEARTFPGWIRKTIEQEWASGVRLQDLHYCLDDWKMLLTQIRKRIPPNPIQATIEMQKSLDDNRRGYFQFRTMIRRFGPSFKKLKYRFTRN